MDTTALEDTKIFGFWLYLMTDLILFAVLFATFLILRNNAFGGPTAAELFHMPVVFAETILLLTSSFTCSLVTYAIHLKRVRSMMFWFGITFLLGLSFLILEGIEFSQLIAMNAGPTRSGFLSSFFSLVGTHGLHIAIGLLWMMVAIVRLWLRPLTPHSTSQMIRLAYFWHFLDVVWIFIFSIVYGIGHLS